MNRDEIVAALTELGRRLDRSGVTGEMYVVGGAAMALAYGTARTTRDIDAVFEPKSVIYTVADEMATELSLPAGWLNDAVKGFLVEDRGAVPVLEVPGLRCLVASPRILLGLKVLAHRAGEDEDDLRVLAGVLGLRDAASVLAIAEESFGDRLDAAARFFVEQTFASD
ncbi:MAG TPA: DUF6036 family nucleotidyltransferase [Actinomycetota bacterium]